MPHPPIIIPAVGKGEEAKISKTVNAYRKAAELIASMKPETILVTTPHSVTYADYLHISPGSSAKGSFARFGAPQAAAEFTYDTEFVAALTGEAKKAGIPAGTFGEKDPSVDHGALVPLTFVNEACKSPYRLVRCSVSGLGPLVHYNYGKCIAETAEKLGRRTVIIASGDLSHKLKVDGPYGFAKEGPEFDRQATDAMKSAGFMRFLTFDNEFCEAAAVCGLPSFTIMAGAFDRIALQTDFLSYEGPFGVGYAVCAFTPLGKDESRDFGSQYMEYRHKAMNKRRGSEDAYVRLARLSLESWVGKGRRISAPEGLPDEMLQKRAGVFVSLKKDGILRGCIGTILPTQENTAEEIMRSAVSAGTRDPRFSPVAPDELPDIVYSVDVLGAPEPVSSESELDVKRYGVIVQAGGGRCGLLLPDLPGIDTVKAQLHIAMRKGGIKPSDSYSVERFQVVRHT